MKKTKKKKNRFPLLRIMLKGLLGLVLVLFLLIIFIRSQWGQDIIKDKLISSLSEKTQSELEVDRLFISFSGNIILEDLYMEDQNGDTLVFSEMLEADIPLWPIIRGKDIEVNSLVSSGFKANIIRKDSIKGFNYEFILEALAPKDTTTAQPVDTSATQRNIIIKDIKINDFDLLFEDQVAGMETSVLVGTLGLTMEVFDLTNLKFHASEAVLSNSEISYIRTKSMPEKVDEEEVPLPYVIADELIMENVIAHYQSVPDGLLADLDIGDLSLKLPEADLAQNIIDIQYFHLNNSTVSLETSSVPVPARDTPAKEPKGFQWPAWDIALNEISMANNDITYRVQGTKSTAGVFNPENLDLRNLHFKGSDIYLHDREAGGRITDLILQERSGMRLKNSGLLFSVDDNSIELDDLVVNLNENSLRGELSLNYNSMQEFMEFPEGVDFTARIPEFYLVPQDLFLFQPSLKSNEAVRAFARKNLWGQLNVNGTLASFNLPSVILHWGNNTNIKATGRLRNPMEPANLIFDFPNVAISSTRQDIASFIDEDSLGVQIPERLALNGSVKGSMQNVMADVGITSSEGDVLVKGFFNSRDEIAFDAEVAVLDLDLGAIMQNEKLGKLKFTMNADGQGSSLNTLDAHLESTIESFQINGYPITDLDISGELKDGKGPMYTQYKDENLEMEMENFLILDTVASQINVNLDVLGANLQALGITRRLIRVGFGFDASFRGDGSEYDVNAEIVDGVTVYGNKSYLLGDFLVSARVRSDSTALNIVNQLLDVNLRSNADPASFARALQRHYRSYLSASVQTDTVINPVNLQLHAEIRENPILTEVFFAQLDALDTVDIDIDFREKDRELVADINLPYFGYSGSEIDSLGFHLNSNRSDFNFSLGFNSIDAAPLSIRKTKLEGKVENKLLLLDFTSGPEEEPQFHFQTEVTRRSDTVTLALNPSELVINSQQWDVPADNLISVAPKFMAFQNFRLSRENQGMEITNDLSGVEEEHIALAFENFSLESFLGFFNPEEPLASGNLEGNLIIEDPFGGKGMIADVGINDFEVLEVPMGVLSLNAEAVSRNDYNFDLSVKEGKLDLDLTGGYTAAAEGAQWETQLDLNKVEMQIIEAFSFGELKDSEGSFSGNIHLTGTFVDPEYSGELHFQDAGFTISKLNAPFTIREETLSIETEGLVLDEFTIEDQNSNTFIVNGEIITESLLNPEFDLNLIADDFMVLNSTRKDNDLLYGTAVIDLDAQVTGTLNIPNVQMDLDIGSETDLTYIIPESEIGIERREGIVTFVNRENPDAILTATQKESYALSGIEIQSTISLDEEAVFNVILDEQTGDNLQVEGEGDLQFNIFSNGRTTLSGRYEMSGGHYEMNLYGLVNRRFEIVEGSSISWAGDPFDAYLDLKASYMVETSASDLMAAQIGGADTSVRNRFRQELPFIVYLDIGGQLMQPVLNFGLDMPEEEQGAIGGQVYGRVQQINQQEQELNQQVFSLLVLNRFYPSSGSDGSGGGTLNIARDNLNDALSDQLNVISGNILGEESDFVLDFGLDTFTDYQGESPRERTQLDITAEKAFMDDRLVARVGSEVDIQGSAAAGEETPLIGNVSLEYLIDETGTWRLRGFRSNRFENVIEGQVIVSGIALIFQREFNKFKELFKSLKSAEEKPKEK